MVMAWRVLIFRGFVGMGMSDGFPIFVVGMAKQGNTSIIPQKEYKKKILQIMLTPKLHGEIFLQRYYYQIILQR
jgi:hypothetical protein